MYDNLFEFLRFFVKSRDIGSQTKTHTMLLQHKPFFHRRHSCTLKPRTKHQMNLYNEMKLSLWIRLFGSAEVVAEE